MAYDFLGLVNDVNRRLNEVELTTSNFSTATGEYGMIKDAVKDLWTNHRKIVIGAGVVLVIFIIAAL